MKKKVFLFGYMQTNLGDDLFIELMLKKYPEIDFEIYIDDPRNTNAFKSYKNLNIINKKDRDLSLIDIDKYDAFAFVSGSIFMENVGKSKEIMLDYENFIMECKAKNKPFYYISSNFGPYTTKEFYNSAKHTFENCENVCFRDMYSYNLFKDVPTVTYAPDLVFLYDGLSLKEKKDTIGITLIDLSERKDLEEYEEQYYCLLNENIMNYINNNMQVYLFAFCENEGDRQAIDKLLKIIPENVHDRIQCLTYRGNTREFLDIYSSMEYMICTRFHATILSAMLSQKAYHMVYSNKTSNVINDLGFEVDYKFIQQFNKQEIINFERFKRVDKEKIDQIKKDAEGQLKHFNKLK